ncbi:uncharacterized protein OCT59_002241 [Rhizophagus irregularis]|uniref:uncharacterized protein n=1 Tax=Rhizophagus irregularis TaxID=588596 RepID=UPI00331A762C|nr:hypothetical protein OCT59_002241 [Rhizophagus irregularis]
MKWTPKNKRQKEHLLVTLGDERNAPGDSWRRKERPLDERNAPGDSWRRKKCLLETLGDEKNPSQRLLETKDFLFSFANFGAVCVQVPYYWRFANTN